MLAGRPRYGAFHFSGMSMRRSGWWMCGAWALALSVGATHASTIFKFRDADGVWHYSDKNPGRGHTVETLHLFGATPAQQRTVFVEKRGDPSRPQLVVVNRNHAPVEVQLTLRPIDNVRAVSVPTRVLVPGRRERQIVALEPAQSGRPLKYDYSLRWQLGDPDNQPQDFAYQPPVPQRGSFPVSQGFNGATSHFREDNRYSLDIAMPIGTAVQAARGGLVVSVEESGGRGEHIYILHDDGTFGLYAHLRRKSALVQPGLRVRTGQIIAQSGNTGYSTGPHLHFGILRNGGLKWEAVPFRIALGGEVVTPKKGLQLSHSPANSVAVRE
jgi:murein DD-endopeptidase MepM/ murein hydrolase activator NlpD